MASKSDKGSVSMRSGRPVTTNRCCLLKMLRTTRTLLFLVILGPKGARKEKATNGENGRKIKHGSKKELALAGIAQWIERWPVNQGVAGSITV